MKRLLLILILALNIQSLAKADDINDFEIEGISIGKSLLNYFSEETINNAKTHIYRSSIKYPNIKYIILKIQEYKNL
jgi:hypothetical protein